jgi:histidinol dehydrogenase
MMEVTPGVTLERRWSPLRSVGIYVPKGLVSSLIMSAVPAQVAGVERIVVCTPPNGSAAVAATAALLGIDEVWAIGGAQAIAAMAYGTESIQPVDKIFGPWKWRGQHRQAFGESRRGNRPARGTERDRGRRGRRVR